MEFKKSELKDGMIVELRDDTLYIKIGNLLCGYDEHLDLDEFDEELRFIAEKDLLRSESDIVRIYEIGDCKTINAIFSGDKLKLIESKKTYMTAEELKQYRIDQTGEDIEIIPNENEMIGYLYTNCHMACNCLNCALKDSDFGNLGYCDKRFTDWRKVNLEKAYKILRESENEK